MTKVFAILCPALVLYVFTSVPLAQAQEAAAPEEPPSAKEPSSTGPQPGPPTRPQAKSPEEAAAHKAFLEEKNPDQQIRLVEDFLLYYPQTELKESAYVVAMQAYQAKSEFDHVLTYGELVLTENPENVTALLTLATAISETTARDDFDGDVRLTEGDEYAREALEVIGRLRRPPGFPEEEWNAARRESESVAHAARGLIALIREDFVRAELQLKEAVALARNPAPALLYRLGMSYSFQKKYAEAVEVLDRAASMGGIQVATAGGYTRDIVAEARAFASRALADSAPPAEMTTPEMASPEPQGEPPGPAP
jgi:tetratricopeptide (TPR) repeat protein